MQELDQIFKAKWFSETGIATRIMENYLFIATCTHIVAFLYHATRRPFSAAQLNDLLTIEVTCSHAGRVYIHGGLWESGPTHQQLYVGSTVIEIRR